MLNKSLWRGLIFVLVIIWICGIAHFAYYKSSNNDGIESIEDTFDQLNLHNSTVQQTDIEHSTTKPVQTTTFATTNVTITTDSTRPIENMFLVENCAQIKCLRKQQKRCFCIDIHQNSKKIVRQYNHLLFSMTHIIFHTMISMKRYIFILL